MVERRDRRSDRGEVDLPATRVQHSVAHVRARCEHPVHRLVGDVVRHLGDGADCADVVPDPREVAGSPPDRSSCVKAGLTCTLPCLAQVLPRRRDVPSRHVVGHQVELSRRARQRAPHVQDLPDAEDQDEGKDGGDPSHDPGPTTRTPPPMRSAVRVDGVARHPAAVEALRELWKLPLVQTRRRPRIGQSPHPVVGSLNRSAPAVPSGTVPTSCNVGSPSCTGEGQL